MKKLLFAKQLHGGLWQWQELEPSDGILSSAKAQTGDAEALAESFAQQVSAQVVVMLPGQCVLSQLQTVDEATKRHMAKLLPYEMEDEIIDPVDEVFFSFSAPVGERVQAIYTKDSNIAQAITELESVGCDIQKIVPDYLCLARADEEIVLVVDDGKVYARTGIDSGFTIELDLLGLVLSEYDLLADNEEDDDTETLQLNVLPQGTVVRLVGDDEDQLARAKAQLPKAWTAEAGPEVVVEQGDFWQSIDTQALDFVANLRKGKFARQLPFKRWATIWKVPAIAAGVAFVLAVASVTFDTASLKKQSLAARQEMQAVYKSVVPNGRASRDPVAALRSLTKGSSAKALPSNAILLVDITAKAMQVTPDIKLTKMRYAGEKRELRISIESQNSGDFEQLRKAVVDAGFEAELLRVNRQGERELASVRIAEKSS